MARKKETSVLPTPTEVLEDVLQALIEDFATGESKTEATAQTLARTLKVLQGRVKHYRILEETAVPREPLRLSIPEQPSSEIEVVPTKRVEAPVVKETDEEPAEEPVAVKPEEPAKALPPTIMALPDGASKREGHIRIMEPDEIKKVALYLAGLKCDTLKETTGKAMKDTDLMSRVGSFNIVRACLALHSEEK